MISFHSSKDFSSPNMFASGFRSAEIFDMERISRCITQFVWSPIVWENGIRHQSKFLAVRLCALDFDDGDLTLENAVNSFCDMTHVIGVTKSHQKEKNGIICDRFRVVLVFESKIENLEIYKSNMALLTRIHGADKACKDGARFFYPCNEIVSVNNDGYFQEVKNEILEIKKTAIPQVYKDFRQVPPKYIRVFEKMYGPSNRNNAVFYLARRGLEVGLDVDGVIRILESTRSYSAVSPLSQDELIRTIKSGLMG